MKRYIALFSVLLSPLFSGATALTPAEKAQRAEMNITNEDNLTVAEVIAGGKRIRLSDGSLWKIHPQDVDKTGGWLGPADVKITDGSNADYPYRITNLWTETTVSAKRITENNSLTPAK